MSSRLVRTYRCLVGEAPAWPSSHDGPRARTSARWQAPIAVAVCTGTRAHALRTRRVSSAVHRRTHESLCSCTREAYFSVHCRTGYGSPSRSSTGDIPYGASAFCSRVYERVGAHPSTQKQCAPNAGSSGTPLNGVHATCSGGIRPSGFACAKMHVSCAEQLNVVRAPST